LLVLFDLMMSFFSTAIAIGLMCFCHLALAFPHKSLRGSAANTSAVEQSVESIPDNVSLSHVELRDHATSNSTSENASGDMIRFLTESENIDEKKVLKKWMKWREMVEYTKEEKKLVKGYTFKAGYDALQLKEKLREAQAIQEELSGLIKNALNLTSARFCARKDGHGNCEQDFSCHSDDALLAQGETFWMPCGALTIRRPLEDNSQRPLCPTKNIITSKEECLSASEQLQKQWKKKVESGFSESKTTSHLLMRPWILNEDPWLSVFSAQLLEHGPPPGWAPTNNDWEKGKSKGPLGCSIDMTGAMVRWNGYKMDQSQQEWEQGATYTHAGGLMHSEFEGHYYFVGICKD
jgi:uncharacterized protein YktA (UPF0223 family)